MFKRSEIILQSITMIIVPIKLNKKYVILTSIGSREAKSSQATGGSEREKVALRRDH